VWRYCMQAVSSTVSERGDMLFAGGGSSSSSDRRRQIGFAAAERRQMMILHHRRHQQQQQPAAAAAEQWSRQRRDSDRTAWFSTVHADDAGFRRVHCTVLTRFWHFHLGGGSGGTSLTWGRGPSPISQRASELWTRQVERPNGAGVGAVVL